MEDIGELAVEVIEDTVGQFTGLHDKNGVEIFEGIYSQATISTIPIILRLCSAMVRSAVNINQPAYICSDLLISMTTVRTLGYWCEEDYTSHIQIIGNIHDNPKLLS